MFSRKIFAKLLQILGLSSLCTAFGCSLLNRSWGTVFMYGVPSMYGVPGNFFTLEGTVTDENGNAINGIEVNVKSQKNQTEDSANSENAYIQDQTHTNEAGKFSLTWNDMDERNLEFTLEIKDIDGEKNGSFVNKSDSITFTTNDISGRTDFGNTKYKKENKQIKLSKK